MRPREIVPLLGDRPVQIMIDSQAVSPIDMPLVARFVLIPSSWAHVHRGQAPTVRLNAELVVPALFSFLVCNAALAGFFVG